MLFPQYPIIQLTNIFSQPTSPRWFTCTPVAFGGGPDFFARDSGLLCQGFQSIGVESRAVMPGPPQAGDKPDLIRTEFKNLESAAWWKAHQLDGVVLYAWGRPKFRKVARAIHEAGIFLVLNQDNGGLVSPLAGPADWLREQWILAGGAGAAFLRKVARGLTVGLVATDPLRAWHLRQGDVIACVSPQAAAIYQRLCRIYGGRLDARIRVVPHPVEPSFVYRGETKMRQILCVGRWEDDVQKRPDLLMRVAGMLVDRDDAVRIVIAGNTPDAMRAWHAALAPEQRARIELAGRLDRPALAAAMNRTQVFFSPSAFESFGIAAAEALCCGCSVTAAKSVSMASLAWFVSGASRGHPTRGPSPHGTLTETDHPDAHAAALMQELDHWQAGQRDAHEISSTWTKHLHADQIAARILDLQSQKPPSAASA
jgi:glycosyltransferase involved in cell wall biosynthesis